MVRRRGANWRDEVAAGLMAKTLSGIAMTGSVLVMLEDRDEVAGAVLAAGGRPHAWHRMAREGRVASPWPDGGPVAAATLRLPKAKEELEMAVHAAAASLQAAAPLWVYGANDEGAGSAEGRIREILGSATTVASGGRCRVLESMRPEDMPGLLGTLDTWQTSFPLDAPHLPATWKTLPGVFAHGRLDAGTRALMETIPMLSAGARVLDFACGSGLLGGYVAARQPEVSVDFLDADTVALEAVEANIPEARTILSDGLRELGDRRYDLIVSNPPYHEGKDETSRVLEELARGAPAHLTEKGTLLLVTQRRLPVQVHLEAVFGTVQAVFDDGPHRIWRASVSPGGE